MKLTFVNTIEKPYAAGSSPRERPMPPGAVWVLGDTCGVCGERVTTDQLELTAVSLVDRSFGKGLEE
jgi:hypothetical protein